jgi:GntR family transcriptional regulator/MocR family aminotransferase
MLRLRADAPGLTLDAKSKLPLNRQLYERYRALILSGQLRAHSQLPSSRELAQSLGVSRNTVLNALDQLVAEGYLQGKVGAGTFVSELPPELLSRRLEPPVLQAKPELSWEAQRDLGYFNVPTPARILPFWTGVPALDKFPSATWARLMARRCREAEAADLHYADPAGDARLRTLIAQYLREFRSLRCEADQVVIVSGSQQSLYLIARVLLNRDDCVAIEEPSYPGARRALTAGGARLLAVPVDGQGICLDGVQFEHPVKAVYVTPSHQCPLGVTMSLQRRLELLDWSSRSGAWIIEDDFDTEYRYSSRPLSSLQGLDSAEQVLYVGTFSKVMFPGLRIGYLVLPKRLVRAFCIARQTMDFCPPYLGQAALADFIEEGHFVRHVRRMRRIHGERQAIMVDALRREFGDTVEIANTDSGLNLVLWLPPGVDDVEVQRKAWSEGIFTFPVSSIFYTTPHTRSGLFLGFAGLTPQKIRSGVKALRIAMSRNPVSKNRT